MRKIFFALGILLASVSLQAQTFNVETGGVTYVFPSDEVGDMTYSNGDSLHIMGRGFALGEISRMYVDSTMVEGNTVCVNYEAESARAIVAGNVARYVGVSVEGANVSIVQSDLVGDATCGEISYILSGEAADGSFCMAGTYKAKVTLNGLTLANTSGAAIDLQNGKRIKLTLSDGTVNSLTDGSAGEQKGCLVCKGHLEIKGTGTLNVEGNSAHGIFAKEYVEIKEATINILHAVKDGVNCNQYFSMESGALNISGVGDDGLQVSFKDDADRDAEDTGCIFVDGGDLTIGVTAAAAKAMKADGSIIITAGTFDLSTAGGGKWDATEQATKASSCLKADANVSIGGGDFTMLSKGSGGKGISCDSTLTISGGRLSIETQGGLYAYVNGQEYPSYTGNSDGLDSNQKSSPKGIRAEGDVVIGGGEISVTCPGNGGEGIESKNTLTIEDGTIIVNSYDDGLNSSGHLYVNGGDLTVVATNNDALDSNGNLYISGGFIRAFGGSQPETGIDANTERGYTVYFTGGTLLAVGGGSNSTPSSGESTQCYVTGSASATAGATVSLQSGNTTLASFTVPETYKSSSSGGRWSGGNGGFGGSGGNLLITCPGLEKNASYTLNVGTTSSTVTATQQGGSSRPW